MVQREPETPSSSWKKDLVKYKSLLHGSGIEYVKGSQRETEPWHCESPVKATGKTSDFVVVKISSIAGVMKRI